MLKRAGLPAWHTSKSFYRNDQRQPVTSTLLPLV